MAAVEVILLERVENLGQMGDVVRVKPGFARNYLLPQRKAMRANKANRSLFEAQRATLEAVNLKRRQEAESVGEKMNGLRLVLIRAAGESGQLYGSVAARDIQETLKDEGTKVERRQIELDHVIKSLGETTVRVRLHPEVAVTIAVVVARSLEEVRAASTADEDITAEQTEGDLTAQDVTEDGEQSDTATA